DFHVTGVQTCALPIFKARRAAHAASAPSVMHPPEFLEIWPTNELIAVMRRSGRNFPTLQEAYRSTVTVSRIYSYIFSHFLTVVSDRKSVLKRATVYLC